MCLEKTQRSVAFHRKSQELDLWISSYVSMHTVHFIAGFLRISYNPICFGHFYANGWLNDHYKISLYSRNRCTEDYVQIYRGASTSSSDLIRYGGFTDGRICNREDTRFTFFTTERIVTVYYRTNGRNIRSDVTGLQIAYDLRGIYKFCLPFCSTMLHIILNKKIME